MRRRIRWKTVTRWLLYALLLVVALAMQAGPGWFEVAGVKPVLVVPVCLAVALYEGELAGGLFGAFGGLLWDISSGRITGFLAIQLLLLCFFVACLWQLYLRNTWFNFVWLTWLACLAIRTVDFIIYYYLAGYYQPGVFYIENVIPSAIYTAMLAAVFRLLAGRIYAVGRTGQSAAG